MSKFAFLVYYSESYSIHLVTYPEFEARWKPAGGAERANYGLFLQDLCDLIGVARPDPTTDNPTQDAYVLERAVVFQIGGNSIS